MERTELAKSLGADYMLLVTVLDFQTRRPGSQHVFQGYLSAEASVWEAAVPESSARLWYCSDMVATWPDDPVLGRLDGDDRQVRFMTQKRFAAQLTRKFHKHKAPEAL